jgi:hypothetical protein
VPINQPYDPHYNPKVYVPKLTEEQRLARATPLENLRGLRFRSEAPVAPVEVPIPAESVTQAPAPQDSATPEEVPVPPPAPDDRPTALEVVFAEFPEIFAHQGERPLVEAHADDKRPVSAGRKGNDAAWNHPRHSKAHDRSQYTALLAYETGTQTFPVPLHLDVGCRIESAMYPLRNQTYPTPGRGSTFSLVPKLRSSLYPYLFCDSALCSSPRRGGGT